MFMYSIAISSVFDIISAQKVLYKTLSRKGFIPKLKPHSPKDHESRK